MYDAENLLRQIDLAVRHYTAIGYTQIPSVMRSFGTSPSPPIHSRRCPPSLLSKQITD